MKDIKLYYFKMRNGKDVLINMAKVTHVVETDNPYGSKTYTEIHFGRDHHVDVKDSLKEVVNILAEN